MHAQELMGHNTDLVTEVNHQLQVEAWSLRQAVHNAVSNAHEHTENPTGHSWLQAKEMLEVVLNWFFADLEALNQVSHWAASVLSAATSVQNNFNTAMCSNIIFFQRSEICGGCQRSGSCMTPSACCSNSSLTWTLGGNASGKVNTNRAQEQ